MTSLPKLSDSVWSSFQDSEEIKEYFTNSEPTTYKIYNVLETDNVDCDLYKKHLLADKALMKYCNVLDIVTKDSLKSCCFTKAYTHYAEGTGSVYCPFDDSRVKQIFDLCESVVKDSSEYLSALQSLHLRYFTPTEVSQLMCFPEYSRFSFPAKTTTKQKYRLLGNSINVKVVSLLIMLMVCERLENEIKDIS